MTVYQPEPFEASVLLYLEDDEIRPVTLTVRGVGTAPAPAPRDADHAAKSP